MKKSEILDLIKAHVNHNDSTFRSVSYDIAREFNEEGDSDLSDYILSLLSSTNSYVEQSLSNDASSFFVKFSDSKEPLYLPESIKNDLLGIVNAISNHSGITKFLFEGAPGTGKTESVRQLGRLLHRTVYSVNFDSVIDSRLGQTSKNIVSLFKEINGFSRPAEVIVLFDEIDALALDRINGNDLREMGRATSSLLKALDGLDKELVLIATTNLYQAFDKALIRRFDAVIDFDRYSKNDLFDIADRIVQEQSLKFDNIGKDSRLLHKILNLSDPLPMPGDLKNIIKTSIAFSNPHDSNDYLRRLYQTIRGSQPSNELQKLSGAGFTCREIEVLTGISKSEISRRLKGVNS